MDLLNRFFDIARRRNRKIVLPEGDDTRIIAASNRDLLGEVRSHHFREDLFSRLNVIALQVPSLRKRRGLLRDQPQGSGAGVTARRA